MKMVIENIVGLINPCVYILVLMLWPFFLGGESGQDTYRSMICSLEQQVQDLKDQNALLKTLVHKITYDEPKPEVARWELVKTHMAAISKRLMLGLDPKKNRPFPREEHIKEAILEAFDTSPTDSMTRKVFDRMWVETLRRKVKLLMSNRRGRFSTTTRTQLWQYLGVPKPQQATQVEMEEWKQRLVPLAEGIIVCNLV